MERDPALELVRGLQGCVQTELNGHNLATMDDETWYMQYGAGTAVHVARTALARAYSEGGEEMRRRLIEVATNLPALGSKP